MNVDKFGHHVHKRQRITNCSFLVDQALTKSEEGDFNLHSSRLKGTRLPVSPDEVANKQYVDHINTAIQSNLANIILTLKRNESRIREIEEKLILKEDLQKIITDFLSKSPPKDKNTKNIQNE